jgi:hypothetical protein
VLSPCLSDTIRSHTLLGSLDFRLDLIIHIYFRQWRPTFSFRYSIRLPCESRNDPGVAIMSCSAGEPRPGDADPPVTSRPGKWEVCHGLPQTQCWVVGNLPDHDGPLCERPAWAISADHGPLASHVAPQSPPSSFQRPSTTSASAPILPSPSSPSPTSTPAHHACHDEPRHPPAR